MSIRFILYRLRKRERRNRLLLFAPELASIMKYRFSYLKRIYNIQNVGIWHFQSLPPSAETKMSVPRLHDVKITLWNIRFEDNPCQCMYLKQSDLVYRTIGDHRFDLKHGVRRNGNCSDTLGEKWERVLNGQTHWPDWSSEVGETFYHNHTMLKSHLILSHTRNLSFPFPQRLALPQRFPVRSLCVDSESAMGRRLWPLRCG